MHIGFTGTQLGMTEAQKNVFERILLSLQKKKKEKLVFHHGDCIGADAEAHKIAKALGYWIIGHPPENESKRAFCNVDDQEEPYEYLYRNTRIAKCSDLLIATPKEYSEQMRSGTWSTIRRGRTAKKNIIIIFPNGSVSKEAA